ncbi:MAG: SDR family oxidoreductase [Cyclobacteriaceae bacterium]
MDLINQVIVVTGGSGLIGQAIVKDLQSKGATVINFDLAKSSTNVDDSLIECDITDEKSMSVSIEKVIHKYGKITGLVNNAYPRTPDWGNKVEDVSVESWRKNVDMQMSGVFFLSKEICTIMTTQEDKGSVVNIASIYGVVGNDFTLYEGTGITSPIAYSFIKGGMINFTRYLASYYGKSGVRVNTVSPGGIVSDQSDVFIDNYEKKVPLGRLGTPEDIAPAVTFLLDDGAKYITGHNLIVDGGWTAI